MTLLEILKVADRHYPDGMILLAWNERAGRPRARSQGDTLALFIVNELYETYDPDRTDAAQLEEVARVLRTATGDIAAVHAAFEALAAEKLSAEWCARAADEVGKSTA